jgi:hypothetical protein
MSRIAARGLDPVRHAFEGIDRFLEARGQLRVLRQLAEDAFAAVDALNDPVERLRRLVQVRQRALQALERPVAELAVPYHRAEQSLAALDRAEDVLERVRHLDDVAHDVAAALADERLVVHRVGGRDASAGGIASAFGSRPGTSSMYLSPRRPSVRIVAFVSVRMRVATSASTCTRTTMSFVVGSDAKRSESTEPIGTPDRLTGARLQAVRAREASS